MLQKGIAEFLNYVKGAGLVGELAEKYNIEKRVKKSSLCGEGRRPHRMILIIPFNAPRHGYILSR